MLAGALLYRQDFYYTGHLPSVLGAYDGVTNLKLRSFRRKHAVSIPYIATIIGLRKRYLIYDKCPLSGERPGNCLPNE